MPGPITYAAIALMARDRLRSIQAALAAKLAERPAATDLERQIAYLAGQALAAMDAGQPTVTPPLRLYGPATDQASKFLFMGAVGPEITGFAAVSAPLQRWLRDTLHKGTPDAHFEQQLAYSTDFLLAFWGRAGAAVTREVAAAGRAAVLAQLKSYALGHACHIAADVVIGPYVDALEARLGDAARPPLNRTQVVAAIDTLVQQRLFTAAASPAGLAIDGFWPDAAGVPPVFYGIFREALEATYGAGASREGGAPYEAMRALHAPPALSRGLLEDGYRSFRHALGMGQSWTLLEWMGFTACMYLPALVALPVVGAMTDARDLFRDSPPAGHDADAGLFEAFNLPFAVGSVVPLAYTLGLTFSPLGTEGPVIFSWVSAAAQVIAAVFFFATLGRSALEAKWTLLFALPLVIEIACIVYVLTQVNADNPRRWLLALSSLTHLGLGAVFMLLLWAFLHKAPEALNDGDAGAFVGWFLLWFLILGALWMGTALLMRFVAAPIPAQPAASADAQTLGLPAGVTAEAMVGRSVVHLIDDGRLSFATPLPDPPSSVARYYPSDRRPLLKLWWTGGNPATVLARHDRLEFTLGGTQRVAFAPSAPVTLAELIDYLKAVATDGTGQAALQAAYAFPGQAGRDNLLLPAGLLFADHGDDRGLLAEHDAQALLPRPLGVDEAHAYTLFAAPRRVQAVPFDRLGPRRATADAAAPIEGTGVMTADAALRVLSIPAGSATHFTQLFAGGDLVEVDVIGPPAASVRRVVLSVDSDTQLTVMTPLPSAPLIAGTYRRVPRQRSGEEVPPAGGQVQVLGDDQVRGIGGVQFGAMFGPGDLIRLRPGGGSPDQVRIVAEVLSDTLLRLHRTVEPPFVGLIQPMRVDFTRVAADDAQLHELLSTGDDTLVRGGALMNDAADLGALLCMGLTSHLLDDAARDRARIAPAAQGIQRAHQVFRNWNLDRRRVNEWRMLVLGGAVDEKAGRPEASDAALGAPPAGWVPPAPDGDAVARELGWVPLLRQWVEMSTRPGNDAGAVASFRTGARANVMLSRALAHLLDQSAPPVPLP